MSLLNKVFFVLSISIFCSLCGNSIWLLLQLNSQYKLLEEFWISTNIIIFLAGLFILFKYLKFNISEFITLSVILFFIFSTISIFTKSISPHPFIEFREVNSKNEIILREYCKQECANIILDNNSKLTIEKTWYSWKYAEFHGVYRYDKSCCYPYSLNNQYILGLLLLLEISFEDFIPLIILISILLLLELSTKKSLTFLINDLLKNQSININKFNLFGIIVFIIVLTYNIYYQIDIATN